VIVSCDGDVRTLTVVTLSSRSSCSFSRFFRSLTRCICAIFLSFNDSGINRTVQCTECLTMLEERMNDLFEYAGPLQPEELHCVVTPDCLGPVSLWSVGGIIVC